MSEDIRVGAGWRYRCKSCGFEVRSPRSARGAMPGDGGDGWLQKTMDERLGKGRRAL